MRERQSPSRLLSELNGCTEILVDSVLFLRFASVMRAASGRLNLALQGQSFCCVYLYASEGRGKIEENINKLYIHIYEAIEQIPECYHGVWCQMSDGLMFFAVLILLHFWT